MGIWAAGITRWLGHFQHTANSPPSSSSSSSATSEADYDKRANRAPRAAEKETRALCSVFNKKGKIKGGNQPDAGFKVKTENTWHKRLR